MYLITESTIYIRPLLVGGLILLLGLLAGELVRRLAFFPRISGYILAGFLVGPTFLNLVTPSLIKDTRIFVDIALGIILFDLGRYLDFSWLKRDHSLMVMSFIESGLTFVLLFITLHFFGLPTLPAALAATVAIATSPAVIMLVAHDLSSDGPVTRRVFILTSLNNLTGLLIFTILIPLTQIGVPQISMIMQALYRLSGSLLLGFMMLAVVKGIGYCIGKRKENQFVLYVGAVILTISLAHFFKVSPMLSVFILGVATRNLDKRRWLTEVDFGWLARLLFILLFVIIGAQLQLQGLWQATLAVALFIVTRVIAKFTGVAICRKWSDLTHQQAISISLALLPMAGVAMGMSNTLMDFNAELGRPLMVIITAVLAILNLLGPIAVQFALVSAEEAG